MVFRSIVEYGVFLFSVEPVVQTIKKNIYIISKCPHVDTHQRESYLSDLVVSGIYFSSMYFFQWKRETLWYSKIQV